MLLLLQTEVFDFIVSSWLLMHLEFYRAEILPLHIFTYDLSSGPDHLKYKQLYTFLFRDVSFRSPSCLMTTTFGFLVIFCTNINILNIFSFGRILKHQQLIGVIWQITGYTVPVAELGSWQVHCTHEFLTPKKTCSCYFLSFLLLKFVFSISILIPQEHLIT